MRVYEGMFNQSPDVEEVRAPETIFDTHADENRLRITSIRPTGIMSDKLNGEAFYCEITSPIENVFRIREWWRAGKRTRSHGFPGINASPQTMAVEKAETGTVCRSGDLVLRLSKPVGFGIEADGRELTRRTPGGCAAVTTSEGADWITDRLDLNPGDLVYGLGERFGPFVRNGQTVRMRQIDAATESDLSYKNVPFYLTNAGYGVFIDSSDLVELEVATAEVNAVRMALPGYEIDYFVIYGPEPKTILERYCRITGFPPEIPRWSWGLWLTTSFTTSYDEKTVREHIDGMTERGIPLSVFHFDCFWMKERHWVDFAWDTDAFPEPERMLREIKRKGIRICLWINPYVSELSALFTEAMESGYLLETPDGDVYQIDWWQPGHGIVDFTNPEACSWYAEHLRRLMEMGVDTFKTDFGENIPEDAVYHSGENGRVMRNLYTRLYNEVVFNAIEETKGPEERALVFARSGTTGSQQYPVHWGGDSQAVPASMAGQLRGGLSLSLSGFAYWSHDIGGFFGKASPGLYKRWVAFGLLSSHSRLHGNDSYRVPWEFDEESVEILRRFTELRHRLVPYLAAMEADATAHGTPVMRPMVLEFPENPTCHTLDRQFMLGPSLLVAPVFDPAPEGSCSYYLPEGTWTDWWSGREVTGGRWISEERGYADPPLFVREGSIIPLAPVGRMPEDDRAEDLEIRLYRPVPGVSLTMKVAEKAIAASIEERDGSLVMRFGGERFVAGDLKGACVTIAGGDFRKMIDREEVVFSISPAEGGSNGRTVEKV